ncbi:hypothetical protein SERLADRAFT_413601 [Serpula lacrymans var. lacrymans S7.9]|uniref:Protein kinase domain-containing protein n=1 Tax=Serpula lacrymans var. lacrymans (strain S7.9) TaxID=578457 RepID=F8NLJ6_SERL9|nr:uncharacterized protein SERLADRAFT_413601 [Serpula lacrymans var. lacrymans S7.9]EGO28920.1 hypothetical protein SERLADRAFT_413601 [Serpula lacrymans var. lacrymans S7.9]
MQRGGFSPRGHISFLTRDKDSSEGGKEKKDKDKDKDKDKTKSPSSSSSGGSWLARRRASSSAARERDKETSIERTQSSPPSAHKSPAKSKKQLDLEEDAADAYEGGHAAHGAFGAFLQAHSKVEQEQTEGWIVTRDHVAQALSSILPPTTLASLPSAPHLLPSLSPSSISPPHHHYTSISTSHPHLSSIAHTAADITHEALSLGADALKFAPIPGLEEAAKALLAVWEGVQMVDMNRLACLRITSRCATLLFSVREEVYEAGDIVGEELRGPVGALVDALHYIHEFLSRQLHRPFLKRYLKRDEILQEIAACDRVLGDVIGLFGISIQTRILKQVMKAAEEQRRWAAAWGVPVVSGIQGQPFDPRQRLLLPESQQAQQYEQGQGGGSLLFGVDTPVIVTTDHERDPSHEQMSMPMSPPPVYSQNASGESSVTPRPGPAAQFPGIPNEGFTAPELEPLAHLEHLRTTQNLYDAARDTADLRALLREALSAESDAGMIERLQVGRSEMPEAIRTLRRVLEAGEGEGEGTIGAIAVAEGAEPRSVDVAVGVDASVERSASMRRPRGDTLDREFMESGIDAMTRLSTVGVYSGTGGVGRVDEVGWDLPSWTITRYEVDRVQKIGLGFFSDVYLGQWRNHVVAIKVLSPATPRSLFIREISIWKDLKHSNVLRLYGASSAAGDPPWFFVSRYCKGGSLVGWLKARRVVAGSSVSLGASPTGGVGLGMIPSVGMGRGRVVSTGSLKSPGGGGGNGGGSDEVDLVRCMHQIAKGMEYLHSRGVLHGDLKASNVLVDESGRLSGTPLPHGTLRWQAPELLEGENRLTTGVDVYAFAICCVEILGMGDLPWAHIDDAMVAHLVMSENKRPILPITRYTTSTAPLINAAWVRDPKLRPVFGRIASQLKALRRRPEESPRPATLEVWADLPTRLRESPDLRPKMGLPDVQTGVPPPEPAISDQESPHSSGESDKSYKTASEIMNEGEEQDDTMPQDSPSSSSDHSHPIPFHPIIHSPRRRRHSLPESEEDVETSAMDMPQPVIYTPSPSAPASLSSSRSSSLFTSSPHASMEDLHVGIDAMGRRLSGMTLGGAVGAGVDYAGYDSPPPLDERLAESRNERRYRLLAKSTHEFHHSLTLPLWAPSHVALGAVGYLSKPNGEFVTLFNSLNPVKTSNGVLKDMPSLYGYGRVSTGNQRSDKRNAAQRGFLDALAGFLTFKLKGDRSYSESVSRRYSFPLRAGHKTAHICAETTMYYYIENLDAPKKWFKANVDSIMQHYGPHHPIQKEDLFLVIGTLDAPDYALFVSHSHPDGQAHFNVFSNPKNGRDWGTFTTDTEFPRDYGGPSYPEEIPGKALSASKISRIGPKNKWDTLLLARLRFKPDIDEPTSL